MTRTPRLQVWAAALIALPLAASCSSQNDPPSASTDPSPPASDTERGGGPTRAAAVALDGRAVTDFFGFVHYRYEELEETEDLAGIAPTRAGVTGTVIGFEEGPQYFEDGGPDSGANVIMRVSPTKTFVGETPEDKVVSVLLPRTGGQTVSDFDDVLPAGASVVLYLSPATDLPPAVGNDLMSPVTPQGFAVALRGPDLDGIAYPLAHEVDMGESLTDQIPADS